MDYHYLQRSHNKIFKRNKFIYKFFKSVKKYQNEKKFYLDCKNFYFIPKLYYFSDKRNLLIIENVGERISKNEFIKEMYFIKIIQDLIIMKYGYYHNDLYYKNVCKNSRNQYFLIDFESSDKKFKNIHKKSKEIYISYKY